MEPDAEGKTVLRRSAQAWMGGLVTAVLMGGLTLGFLIAATALMFRKEFGAALALIVLSLWLLSLLIYVWRDVCAKRSWSVEIEGGELRLDLPAGRSLMSASPRETCRIEVSRVLAIVTRLESFRSFGLSHLQRSYGLLLKSGTLIFLGEDRALSTELADQTMGRMIEVIRLRTGLPLRDQGMVEGRGGLFGLIFTSVSGWDAPRRPLGHQQSVLRHAGMTLGLASVLATASLILSRLF